MLSLLGEEILIFGVCRKEQSHKARALERGIMPRIFQKQPERGWKKIKKVGSGIAFNRL